jgi:hypothetical protein
MEIKNHWNGIRRGQPIKLTRDVYLRDDGTPGGSIHYESPGRCIAKRGMIGTFTAKTDKGVLVSFNNGIGSVLGLVLDEFVVERYSVSKQG